MFFNAGESCQLNMVGQNILLPDRTAILALDGLPVAVSIIAATGALLYYNRKAAELLDRKPEYLGRNVRDFHKKPASNHKIDRMLAEFAAGRTRPFTYEARPYGEPLAVTVTPLFDGERFTGCVQTVLPVGTGR